MISQLEIPAWGGFTGQFTSTGYLTVSSRCNGNLTDVAAKLSIEPVMVGDLMVNAFCSNGTISGDYGTGHCFFSTEVNWPVYAYDGWFGHESLMATVEGYNYLPISFSLTSFWLNEFAAFFVDGEQYRSLNSPGYQYKTADSTNSVAESNYNLHYLQNSVDCALPRMWTSDSFSGWDLQGQSLSGSLVAFLARTFEQVQACLAILSGGTTANFGGVDTSDRVYSAVVDATAAVEEGEGASVSDRLSRIESAVSQLIALTTYSYYISGASVDSAPASGQSVAEGVLNYLKQFLGDGEAVVSSEVYGGNDNAAE